MIQHWIMWLVFTGVILHSLRFLPKELTSKLKIHKMFIGTVYIIASIYIIGSPYRLEATEFTGKSNFSQPEQKVVDKRYSSKVDLAEDINKQKNELRKQQEELQNEINN